MATAEYLSSKEAEEGGTPCKSRKWFLFALFATVMAVILVVVMAVTAAFLQLQISQEGQTMASVTMELSAATTALLPVATTVTTVPREIEEDVYFGTYVGGLKAYSVFNSAVRSFASRNEFVYGVVHDSTTDKLYWSTRAQIYKGNRDGTQVETLWNTKQCMLIP